MCLAIRKQIVQYGLSDHAREEMRRRQIAAEDVAKVLTAPEQRETVREGREVFQLRIEWGEPSRTYLLRVFVDIDCEPPIAVTVYRTSKIAKYWRDCS